MGQQARVNQNLAHATLAQHEDVFDYILQQLKRINGNCDALHAAHESLAAFVAGQFEARPVMPTTFLGRLRWVFRG